MATRTKATSQSGATPKHRTPEAHEARRARASAGTSRRSSARSPLPAKPEVEPIAADSVDAQLARYRSMRDFSTTDEPNGAADVKPKATARTPLPGKRATGSLPFVIQKHAASHLHYDFRLGWSGVLKSWAVAKGPSYYPGDRRLAVEVEDHPIEYGGFEGIIPKGQYGGGTVMVWDQGVWWPQPGHENVGAGLRAGSLKFELHGTRMHGKWTLVRMTGRAASERKPNWLLIKEHDEYERTPEQTPVTDEAQRSVVTGRTMDEIAREGDHVWNSKETAGTGQAWYRAAVPEEPKAASHGAAPHGHAAALAPAPSPPTDPSANGQQSLRIAPRPRTGRSAASMPSATASVGTPLPSSLLPALQKLQAEAQPEFLKPQLAEETLSPPEGAGWLHELKLDGYRVQARRTSGRVQLLTRSGLDWTERMSSIAAAVEKLPGGNLTIDGEVVVLDEQGVSNFARLQASFQQGERHPLTFFCFDLLHLEGRNTRSLPLRERKDLLSKLLQAAPTATQDEVRLSEHLEIGGPMMLQKACELNAEGIVSKRADSAYHAGRSTDWMKAKCLLEQEFVVGGFARSGEGEDRIGSLLLGYYRDGKLVYAGRTGTGFTVRMRRDLRAQLKPLERRTAPFQNLPAEAKRDAVWVEPRLVAQVRFASWTAEDLVRQAAFLGLREDKQPEEVIHEARATASAPKVERSSGRTASTPSPATHTRVKPIKIETAPVRLTHAGKVLDPASSLRKQELADFYWAVAAYMLPHVAGRPLSLVRCPDGAGKPCFYQKHVNHMLPKGIGSVDVADKDGKVEPYITLDSPEALAGLAQIGVLEVHPWSSTNADLEHPDRLIFDLDPDETLPWTAIADAAKEVRERLRRAGLESFLKTTGGKGLHVVAPIDPLCSFAQVKALAQKFVQSMERDSPTRYLTKMTKAARRNKIYLDYLRNERGATAVAPFSPRARAGVNVSVPLAWNELKNERPGPFAVHTFADWGARLRKDPWAGMLTLRQRLEGARIQSI